MFLFKVIWALIDDFVNLELIVSLCQWPELVNEFLTKLTFLEQQFHNITSSLDNLQVSPFAVKNNIKDAILFHPLNKEFVTECLIVAVKHSQVLNDLVQVSDTLDSSLKVRRLQAY